MNTSTEGQLRSRRKAAKMLVVVVVMFAICYFPVHLLSVLRYVFQILKITTLRYVSDCSTHFTRICGVRIKTDIVKWGTRYSQSRVYYTWCSCCRRSKYGGVTKLFKQKCGKHLFLSHVLFVVIFSRLMHIFPRLKQSNKQQNSNKNFISHC